MLIEQITDDIADKVGKDIVSGSRVFLISGQYPKCQANPVLFGSYGLVEGIVTDVLAPRLLKVVWDNGTLNSYDLDTLILTKYIKLSPCDLNLMWLNEKKKRITEEMPF